MYTFRSFFRHLHKKHWDATGCQRMPEDVWLNTFDTHLSKFDIFDICTETFGAIYPILLRINVYPTWSSKYFPIPAPPKSIAAPRKRKKQPISIVSSVMTYHSRHSVGTDRNSANGSRRLYSVRGFEICWRVGCLMSPGSYFAEALKGTSMSWDRCDRGFAKKHRLH